MRVAVKFGEQTAALEVPEGCFAELRGTAEMPAMDDLRSAVAGAIESPIAYPPLRRAVVPGDHVAIVLDYGVPRAADLLEPLVESLREAGAQAHDIRVVAAPSYSDTPSPLTADDIPPGLALERHDPNDRNRLSYLATTTSGRRVYLNRGVVDADLAILVGRVDFDSLLGYCGTASGVFPGLGDAAARRDFRARGHQPITRQSMAEARAETDEIAWLLGVQFAVQVVRGRDADISAVFAGECTHVQREAERRLNEQWIRHAIGRADTVIAALGGSADTQGLDELGRVLESARQLVTEGGRIVVLSAIGGEPGPALHAAGAFTNPTQLLEHLRKSTHADVLSTRQIVLACQYARVCLLSRLADDLVEGLNMTPIGSLGEVQRLVGQATRCMVLNDAQFTRVILDDDDGKSA